MLLWALQRTTWIQLVRCFLLFAGVRSPAAPFHTQAPLHPWGKGRNKGLPPWLRRSVKTTHVLGHGNWGIELCPATRNGPKWGLQGTATGVGTAPWLSCDRNGDFWIPKPWWDPETSAALFLIKFDICAVTVYTFFICSLHADSRPHNVLTINPESCGALPLETSSWLYGYTRKDWNRKKVGRSQRCYCCYSVSCWVAGFFVESLQQKRSI